MNTTKHSRYTVGSWLSDSLPAWWAWIYVAGDIDTVRHKCRELTFPQGLCLTIEPVDYVYAGGCEAGVRVGLIQYPPFPEHENDLMRMAESVGIAVAEASYQWSFTIVTKNDCVYYSRKKNRDAPDSRQLRKGDTECPMRFRSCSGIKCPPNVWCYKTCWASPVE